MNLWWTQMLLCRRAQSAAPEDHHHRCVRACVAVCGRHGLYFLFLFGSWFPNVWLCFVLGPLFYLSISFSQLYPFDKIRTCLVKSLLLQTPFRTRGTHFPSVSVSPIGGRRKVLPFLHLYGLEPWSKCSGLLLSSKKAAHWGHGWFITYDFCLSVPKRFPAEYKTALPPGRTRAFAISDWSRRSVSWRPAAHARGPRVQAGSHPPLTAFWALELTAPTRVWCLQTRQECQRINKADGGGESHLQVFLPHRLFVWNGLNTRTRRTGPSVPNVWGALRKTLETRDGPCKGRKL